MSASLTIDIRFKGVGRIVRRSGVHDPKTFGRMIARFREVAEAGRGRELLRALKRLEITPLELFDLVRDGDLSQLPSPEQVQPIKPLWTAWVERTAYSPDHTRNLKRELRRLERAKPNLTARDLPDTVERLRVDMSDRARSFNYTRAAALAYLRQAYKRSHPLYVAVWGIDPLKVTPKRRAPSLSIKDVERFGHEAVELALTGMLPKEYWGRVFEPGKHGGLLVHGTKRSGRDRRMPMIVPITGPKVALVTFRRRVRKLSDLAVQPKDFRNFYAWLMEEAEIPRTFRRMYLGHGRKDVTDLYEERDVRTFIGQHETLLKRTLSRLRRAKTPKETSRVVGQIGRRGRP